MKKVTMVTLSPAAQASLGALRELGVLHLEYTRRPESPDTERIRAEKQTIEGALGVLSSRRSKAASGEKGSALETAHHVLALVEERGEWQDRLQFVEQEIERLEPLGEFSPHVLAELRQGGLFAKLYRCKAAHLGKTAIAVPYEIVSSRGGFVYILALSREDFQVPLEEVAIPDKGLSHLKEERDEIRRRTALIEDQLDACVAFVPLLADGLGALEERLEFAEALAAMGDAEGLSYVGGYCPVHELDRLRTAGREMGWGMVIEEPREDEDVPTLIENPPWIRIIELVFDFIGTVPGYREYDVSFWFLASLSLFFAMLIGDGGYGLLFLAGSLVLRWRLRSLPPALYALLYVFSGATILWGLITGTWFGAEGLARLPILRGFIVPALYGYADDQDFMIHLCFVIGTVHLTIAHVIRMTRYLGSVRALAELGWILVIWFLYFLGGNLVLFRPFPSLVAYLLPLGLFLVSGFSNPQRHFIRAFFLTLADLPLNVIKSFSDVVSYLRLFAVGYATLVVAVSFNQMASDLGWDSVPRAAGAALILLLGHGLNIVMGAMAVLVHGIRLNMLEFSSHLEMTWSGRKFAPFGRRIHGLDARTAVQGGRDSSQHGKEA